MVGSMIITLILITTGATIAGRKLGKAKRILLTSAVMAGKARVLSMESMIIMIHTVKKRQMVMIRNMRATIQLIMSQKRMHT